MVVAAGMRNFCGTVRWSVRYQLLISTLVGLGLYNSTESSSGRSVCVSASLTKTRGIFRGGSAGPGEPPITGLARQLSGLAGSGLKLGLTGTNENPVPSGDDGQGGRVP